MPVTDQVLLHFNSQKVGPIFIVGASDIPDYIIREMLQLYPGQALKLAEVRLAEKRLLDCGYFVVDPERSVRPRIVVLSDCGLVYRDILVEIQEAPGRPWRRIKRAFLVGAGTACVLLFLRASWRVMRNLKAE